jgi:hypothetical protein
VLDEEPLDDALVDGGQLGEGGLEVGPADELLEAGCELEPAGGEDGARDVGVGRWLVECLVECAPDGVLRSGCKPRGRPGSTGGRVGAAIGPDEPGPGAVGSTGTLTPPPLA